MAVSFRRGILPFPSLPSPYSFLLLLSHPLPVILLPSRLLSLELYDLQIQLRGVGTGELRKLLSSPVASAAEPQPKSNLVLFSLKWQQL